MIKVLLTFITPCLNRNVEYLPDTLPADDVIKNGGRKGLGYVKLIQGKIHWLSVPTATLLPSVCVHAMHKC